MKYGIYIRTSTVDKQVQGFKSQKAALEEYCRNHNIDKYLIYEDKESGSKIDRPGFNQLQQDIFMGLVDTVIVWKIDRISRSLKDGISVICSWLDRDIRLISISQGFDFANNGVGKLILSVLLSVAELERQNIRENIIRGMTQAKNMGKRIGGSDKRLNIDQVTALQTQGLSISAIAKELRCSRTTIYSTLRRA